MITAYSGVVIYREVCTWYCLYPLILLLFIGRKSINGYFFLLLHFLGQIIRLAFRYTAFVRHKLLQTDDKPINHKQRLGNKIIDYIVPRINILYVCFSSINCVLIFHKVNKLNTVFKTCRL